MRKYVRGIVPKEEGPGLSVSKKIQYQLFLSCKNFFNLQNIESALQAGKENFSHLKMRLLKWSKKKSENSLVRPWKVFLFNKNIFKRYRKKIQSIILYSLALILYSVYSIKYYCQHGMGVELVSFSTRFSTKSIFNISFSLLLFSAMWPDEFSNSMSLADWCRVIYQEVLTRKPLEERQFQFV